jgi:sec-independent protein translocase protein TatA
MGSFSLWHWIIVGVVVLLLFGGRGKISSLMGDFAQGIKAFKKGMAEDTAEKGDTPKEIGQKAELKGRADTERKVEGSLS